MNGPVAVPRSPIRRLDPRTVERIAAGEVVERPASAVKELVENAYDAGARTVEVRLSGGGLERIEVADDGVGIPPDELELAVERHATSKLPPDGPIERISSLGFRGEALAAIAAVSRLRLLSRPATGEVAEGIATVGGSVVERFAEPRSVGTTVEVEELFFNTPARRKFLRSAVREQVECVRVLEQLYLARPSVTVRLVTEGGEVASLPATDVLPDAASRVLGPAFAPSAFPLHLDHPVATIDAALGPPALASPTASGLYISVNGRPIVSRPLAQAVRVAFGDTIPRSRFPVGVLHLAVDAGRVDVNVHPTKREVRFADARELEEVVRRGVREALVGAPAPGEPGPVRAFRPASRLDPFPSTPLRPSTTASAPRGLASQRTLTPRGVSPVPASPEGAGGRPSLRLLGVVGALYWIASTDDGLVLVDQHAASERLLYDTLRAGGVLGRQSLVEPVPLSPGAAEQSALSAFASEVRAAGFEVEPFGPGSFRVRAVPSYRGRTARAESVLELVRELSEGGRPTLPNGLEERRAASIACHAAIRAGDPVEPAKISEILAALDRLPDRPRSCPHGRPIWVHLSRSRLDHWFLRSGA